jgi:hypothetical protein
MQPPPNSATPAEAKFVALIAYESQIETHIKSNLRLVSRRPASGLPPRCCQLCLVCLAAWQVSPRPVPPTGQNFYWQRGSGQSWITINIPVGLSVFVTSGLVWRPGGWLSWSKALRTCGYSRYAAEKSLSQKGFNQPCPTLDKPLTTATRPWSSPAA